LGLLVILIWLVSALQQVADPPFPQLDIEAPPPLAAARTRLESFDPARLRGVMRLVGLDDAGPAIRVVLASESSEWARHVPPSTVGFAVGAASVVVLFPSRAPVYPHDTLEDVLHHEISHVLMTRAAGGHPLPRWFHEGVAMAAERNWRLEDQVRLFSELTAVSRTDLDEINALFLQSDAARTRAYTLAGAFVRDLLRHHGPSAPGRLLARVAEGTSFEHAFAEVIGQDLDDAEAAFWRRQKFWTTWAPFLTTQTALWMIVTLLALYAIRRRRQQRAAHRKRWEEEAVEYSPGATHHGWHDDDAVR
jgi:hypothetical protein